MATNSNDDAQNAGNRRNAPTNGASAAELSNSNDPIASADSPFDRLAGWRHGSTWTYLVMLIASVAALVVSFILSGETLELARHPNAKLSCDVNAVVSCSTVAQSWQAEIVHFGTLSFPNAFFGIAAESVFITLAVLGLARARVPRWFSIATWWGGLAAFLYAYWLFSQSMFVIDALCPWCLCLMFATTIQFMALSHATVSVQHIPDPQRFQGLAQGLVSYYRLHFDLMVDVLWIVAVVALIFIDKGAAIF